MKRILLLALSLSSSLAWATNGMFPIGNNARAVAMGGANIAIPSDCSAIACNPAAIASICNRSFAFSTGILMPRIHMETTSTGLVGAENQVFPMPLLAYGDRIGDLPLAYAVGVYIQGGMGAHFDRYDVSGFGHYGSLKSNISFVKFSPTLAYNILENLAVGASFELGYTQLEIDFLPQMPNGFELQDARTLTYNARVGIYYEVAPEIILGFAYTMPTPMNYEGDFRGFGASVDADFSGMRWPQVFEFGFSVIPTERLVLACDISYINWDATMNEARLKPDGFPDMEFPLHWNDQIVFAIGAEYAVGENHKIRVGYNYGENPVPEKTLNPIFPAITEHHMTVGYGYEADGFGVDFAYEHAFENSQTSEIPPPSPFNGYRVSHNQHWFYLTVKFHF